MSTHLHSPILIGALLGALTTALCGCGASSSSMSSAPADVGSSASAAPATSAATPGFGGAASLQGTNDAVIATSAVAGAVEVAVGTTRTLSVTFNSDDGLMITGFGISGVPTLPSGWSSPDGFTCAAVGIGSSCVLNLEYAPTAADSGVLTLGYVYVNDATQPQTGYSLTIPYAATSANHVVAVTSPTGQVNGVAGAGTQAVNINFSTDDGNAATNFTLTSSLTALPPGWTSTVTTLACPIVSTGNGCALALHYAPGAAGGGTLVLHYSYTDESGAAGSGALNIPYAATSANNVVATAAPAGQITAIQKTGGQAVPVVFTTDDGKAATGLYVTTDLKSMPDGWSSAVGSFSCAQVSGGNGCLLQLRYAPPALASGTLTLNYAYRDSAGTARTGLLNVGYAATTNDNVAGTVSPAGPVVAVVSDGSTPGSGSRAVTVTFTTDDARAATALAVTSNLALLPSGWSSAATGSFLCDAIDADTVCRLALRYAPTAAGAGTLPLTYAYTNNAGEARSGSVDIAYRATANDNVQWTASALPASVPTGSSNPLTIAFQTDDGNPATALVVTSSLESLPPGWSSATTAFSCATVSAGTVCALPLLYAPTAAVTAGTLALGYRYVNNAGYAGTGTVTITYGAD